MNPGQRQPVVPAGVPDSRPTDDGGYASGVRGIRMQALAFWSRGPRLGG